MIKDLETRKMLKNVPNADVIVVSDYYSIALSYNSKIDKAPIIVAKGIDKLAQLILRIAKKYNIWVEEDENTCKLIYEESEKDTPILEKFYKPVAIIISHVEKPSSKLI
jgi:flagellar biosynthetic protein FlhB